MIVGLADMASEIVEASAARIPGGMIARVEAYDVATQTADCLPLAQLWTTEPSGERRPLRSPVLYSVPVLWPYVVRSLDVGERVLLIGRWVSHRELDEGAEGPLLPAARARHQLGDAVAIPLSVVEGVGRSDGQPLAPCRSGEALHVGQSTADRALALAQETRDELSALRTGLVEHVHTATSLSVATTPAQDATAYPALLAATQPPVGDVATSRVLVDG